jgi:cytochrome d ubiquinol oxidase subunit I
VADVPAPMVAGSLAVYLSIYVILLAAYVGAIVHMARKAAKGSDGARAAAVRGARGVAPVAIPAE